MLLTELQAFLNKAQKEVGDAEVLLCFEEGAIREGFDEEDTEGISDIRLVDDWPLPGKSLVTNEGKVPQKLIIFYDNHYKLKPADE